MFDMYLIYINSKDTVNFIKIPIKNLLPFASGYLVKFVHFLPSFKFGNSVPTT